MSLALAIRNNAQSLPAVNATYKQNVALVGSFITSVLSSKVPTLNNPPPNMGDFTTAYSKASSDALKWTNEVMNRLISSPESVLSYGSVISDILADATSNAEDLVSNPGDQIALIELHNDLKGLATQIGFAAEFVSGALSASTNFSSSLPDMAIRLQAIASQAVADAGADQAKIDKLNSDVSRLRHDINDLQATIAALNIAVDVEVKISVELLAADWIFGAIADMVIAAIIGIEKGVIKLDSDKIAVDQAAIKSDASQLKSFEQDVAALHLLSSNFGNMAGQVSKMEAAMKEVVQQWRNLQANVCAAVADIKDALANDQAGKYPAILEDLKQASEEWAAIADLAGSLAISLSVTDAKLSVGMTQDQVEAAVASATSTDLVEYVNRPA